MSTIRTILNGPELLEAITATISRTPIKWLDMAGSLLGRVEPAKALEIARAGVYSGKLVGSRIVYIREMEVKTQVVLDSHYLDDMPVIQPYTFGHKRLGPIREQMAHLDSLSNRRQLQAL